MLDATELWKSYTDVPALRGFSLRAGRGEIVGLIGHNGAGKSTFTNIVSGLLRPDRGTVLVDGRPPRATRGLLGVAPQHLALYPTITVSETLALFGGLAGIRRRALAAAISRTAEELRLTDVLSRYVRTLSGGQQRRVHAAAAMVHRPALLLLDEPTAGVDPETRTALLDAVRAHAGEGAAVVYTTHYLPELIDLGASIAVADRGRVIARGGAEELLAGLSGEVKITVDDDVFEVPTSDPARTLAELLPRLHGRLRAVDLRQPTLDDLYREVTRAR